MELTRDEMVAAMLQGDRDYNGRFITGVLTTGIYCLPSCRARKPKPENVRFFPTIPAAQEAGLRACLKCHPDAFDRGESYFDLEPLEAMVADLRANPDRYPDIATMANAVKFGATKFHQSIRKHFHTTPATLLADARVEAAQRLLLESDATVSELALAVGFESLSTFYEHFRLRTGLAPLDYRRLPTTGSIDLVLPASYRADYLLRHYGRDPESTSERAAGTEMWVAIYVGEHPTTLHFQFQGGGVGITPQEDLPPEHYRSAYKIATRILGLGQDPAGFESLLAKIGQLDLVGDRSGARIAQTPSLFDALLWSIVGQQVTLGFAATLRRRVTEKRSPILANGMRPAPTAAMVADMAEGDFVPMQFSRRKVEYLLGAARAVPDIEGASASRVEMVLKATRGLGPWAANYVMMRGFGFADCTPLGDTGLAAGLRKRFGREKLELKEIEELMEAYAPYRSFATFHLWQSLGDA